MITLNIFLISIQTPLIVITLFFINKIFKQKNLKSLLKTRSYGVILISVFYILLLIVFLMSKKSSEFLLASFSSFYLLNFLGLILSLTLIFLQNMKELDFKYKRDLENLESKKGDSI